MMSPHKKHKLNGIFFLLLTFTTNTYISAQTTPQDAFVEPFEISQRHLSGLDIPPVKLKNHPERKYFQKRLYRGTDLSVYILASETATNEFESFPIEEFVFYMNGKAEIQTNDGAQISFLAGDFVFVPKGFGGQWTNNGGNTYHLELSVVSRKRADSTQFSKVKHPFVLDRALISGIGIDPIDNNTYYNELYSGIELKITTESEKPRELQISNLENDQFIHVLTGALTLTPKGGTAKVYHKGAFLVLPKGFSGVWKSEGVNLLRTLKVMQAG